MNTIYDFYEEGILLPEKTAAGNENYVYLCKLCKNVNKKGKHGEYIKIRQEKGKAILNFK